jgi:hypothetical protein
MHQVEKETGIFKYVLRYKVQKQNKKHKRSKFITGIKTKDLKVLLF